MLAVHVRVCNIYHPFTETPWGSLPYVEVEGKTVLGQSIAVTRYAARQAKLNGGNAEEECVLDSIVDGINDFRGKPFDLMFAPDDAKVREN